jgi:hypothetical protein
MKCTPARTIFVLALLAIAFAPGCKKGDGAADKDAKWLGTYKNSKDSSTLVLQTDHKGTLDMAGAKHDVTWEIAGDDKIIVHAVIPISMFQTSDGLRDEEGTVWKKT